MPNFSQISSEYDVNSLRTATEDVVSVEVYYFAVCPHCDFFLERALAPLVEAKLPGNKVQLNIVPMFPPLLQAVRKPELCNAMEACKLSLASLCALRNVGFKPSPADNEDLLRGTRFAVCNVGMTAAGRGRTTAGVRGCAEKAGIQWEGVHGLNACSGGVEGLELLQVGAKPLLAAMHQLHDVIGFTAPPPLPWVFLDGSLLSCDGHGALCTSTLKPTGPEPLPQAGTLLQLVCTRLAPLPDECLVTDGMKVAQNKAALCDDCVDNFLSRQSDGHATRNAEMYTRRCGFAFVTVIIAVFAFREVLAFRQRKRRSQGMVSL